MQAILPNLKLKLPFCLYLPIQKRIFEKLYAPEIAGEDWHPSTSCFMSKLTKRPTYRLTLSSTAEPFAIPIHPGRSSSGLMVGYYFHAGD